MKLLHLLVVVAIAACGPRQPSIVVAPAPPADELPPPNPVVLASDEDVQACRRLDDLRCSDAPKCLETMSQARTDHIPIPSTCLAVAADLAAARSCGDAGTLTFECP